MRQLDDNAQLLLVAGFAVGVGIVVLTIMLNNVIYASNIASESSIDTSRYDIANAAQITSESYQDAYIYAMETGTFNNTAFEEYLHSYAFMASRNFAISGFTFNFENNTLHEPYFTQNGLDNGKDNWTVASNVNSTDLFLMEIPDVSKLGNSSESLMITATNSSGLLWAIELYSSGGQINITIRDRTTILGTYTASGQVNITGDMTDFTTPAAFHFSTFTEGNDYSINVINGSKAAGYCTFSGSMTSGEEFSFARYLVVNPRITMSSSEIYIKRDLPVSLPGEKA
ncbi:hypothetical protein [Methanolobus sp. WCC5]|uniref:hypothetical protein n=1 Tax=Methanolobus sp. WCC5 TaxID=3125785 RepID=UPI003249954F